eukprot:GHVS01008865.1.p1 GENE.GHVS01008865.1~~GHVS01008865.1.p1  ORF type:complete len:522 (-),score=71.00 GHVS01008865.1:249-1814(-)
MSSTMSGGTSNANGSVSEPHRKSEEGGTGTVSVGNIRGFGRNHTGLFKMSNDVFGWKNKTTNRVYQYKGSDVESAYWVKTNNNANQLKLNISETAKESPTQIIRFDGFRDEQYEQVRSHFAKYCKLKLEKTQVALRGWHWGDYHWSGKNLSLDIDKKTAMDIHAPDLSQITAPSKTDLTIEFQQDDTKEAGDDELLEVRFYIPPKSDAREGDAQPIDILKEELTRHSGLGQGGHGMESIVMNQVIDVHLLVPRGRYEIDLGPSALKLHGKSYDYTMQYQNISRMFLVPRPNSPHLAFVIGLENAMRQGQTRYPFVVMQFDEKTDMDITLNMDEKQLQTYSLEKRLSGKLYDVLPRLFKALVGKSIIVPGDFKSTHDQAGVRCSCRAQDGHLYPLGRSFLYIIKPVIFIKYDDVVNVEFSRTSANDTTRYFEVRVSCKGGTEYDFTSIDRNEYQPLVDFLTKKGIRMRNLQDSNSSSNRPSSFAAADVPSEGEEESEDADYEQGASEESSESGEEEDEDDEG